MAIPTWPLQDRPRERLVALGAHALSDAELLAIFLRTGTKGKTAVDLARDILQHSGGLHKLQNMSLAQWQTIPGLGLAKYAQLRACLELAKRSLHNEVQEQNNPLNNPTEIAQLVRLYIGMSTVEQFLAFALDSQLRLIGVKILFTGTINKTNVYPREVARFAIDNNATRLIVAHNHPSDMCQPSAADDHITTVLHQALHLLDIELVDHLVVGPRNMFSYRQAGRTPYEFQEWEDTANQQHVWPA